jgi:hypothetical protein
LLSVTAQGTIAPPAVNLSAEQLQIASLIDAKVQRLVREGHDDLTILGEMLDYMPEFKLLLDSGHGTMDELCRRFAGFYRYAKILETVAAGIQSGAIQVPK